MLFECRDNLFQVFRLGKRGEPLLPLTLSISVLPNNVKNFYLNAGKLDFPEGKSYTPFQPEFLREGDTRWIKYLSLPR